MRIMPRPIMDAIDLAAEVLRVLDLQREYFKTRNPETLNQCRRAEKQLRERCNEMLRPDFTEPPTLFPGA